MESILHSVMNFEVIGPYRLRVFFEDDTCQDIDFRPVLAGRIFSPLKDLSLFNQVSIEDDLLTWPNGAEFSSDTLYNWPKQLPVLREQAWKWKRGFEVSAEDSQQIIFDWDEINELVDGNVEEYKKRIPYFYNAMGRLELDLEVARRLYLLEPHEHIRRRIETLQETIDKIREHLKSCLEEFGDGVEKELSQYCSTSLKLKNENGKIKEELQSLEKQLRSSKNEWQWHVAKIITEIPPSHLATYGCIAKIANQHFGHTLTPLNVAWLRKHLYALLTHNTHVPLHRIAKAGDVKSLADSPETREHNDRLRGREGSLENPVWWHPCS